MKQAKPGHNLNNLGRDLQDEAIHTKYQSPEPSICLVFDHHR